ncbi:MAG: DUF262 domain-containing protein [Muribaculaceae bacterium]|nr:DUF262 domain-containing protein [Muribaculaceae bacterium]
MEEDFKTIEENNNEDAQDLQDIDTSGIVVYARDWTIQTIYSQIAAKNIDLNPKFQRRNAWRDNRRSKLIESIIMGYPIPEIVLAEDPAKKRSFIVIDGKQRLLSIAGFIDHENYKYWDTPSLRQLTVCKELNGLSYSQLPETSKREFDNSSLRCTVITNYNDVQVLYDIFYRLNSGSVPLSSQELRQVLNKGSFADYLIEITKEISPIHKVMGLKEPDDRLRDVEIILRIMTMYFYAKEYKGNLRRFLDESMKKTTNDWAQMEQQVKSVYDKIIEAISLLENIFGNTKNIGRKYKGGDFEKRFNKVLFEVEIFYFMNLNNNIIQHKEKFIEGFKQLSSNDSEFLASIESSTKNIENYKIRYDRMQKLINSSFDLQLNISPFS